MIAAALLALALPAFAQHDHHGGHGPYASGTSWQPASSPMEGWHGAWGDWDWMLHGQGQGAFTRQGGPRGDSKFVFLSMLMGSAERPLGPGKLVTRTMLSLDPAMGPFGYPLLFQTGESGDGRRPLVDRQHPHDLFMELSALYRWGRADDWEPFVYFGFPGEPALGPSVFMHRFSGADIPEAPLSHHWLDSTHISYGVATAGASWNREIQLEASLFTGREPDHRRWDMERPRFDSWSARASWNPDPAWSLQASFGRLKGPEALDPDVDIDRLTFSASYAERWNGRPWGATFAWGRNRGRHPHSPSAAGHLHGEDPTDAFLLEGTLRLSARQTVLGRAERVDKEELPVRGTHTVNKISAGYIFDLWMVDGSRVGLGALGSLHVIPSALRPAYGRVPLSFMIWIRGKIG